MILYNGGCRKILEVAFLATSDPITDPLSLRQKWKSWKWCLETYIAALNLIKDKRKRMV